MTEDNIVRLSKRYWKHSLWLVAALTIVAFLVIQIFKLGQLVVPVIVSSVFSLVTAFAYSIVWKIVAVKHPDSLTAFYTASSGFRFLLALVTMLVFYLIEGRGAMLGFVLVFMAAYLIMLVYHTICFSKITSNFSH